MAEINIFSIAFCLAVFGLSLIIFLIYPRQSRETTVPGPDKPASDAIFNERLQSLGIRSFLSEIHKKYGGMVSFYLENSLVFSITDEEIITKFKPTPIPLSQHLLNLRSDGMEAYRQRFRKMKKWFETQGGGFGGSVNNMVVTVCAEYNTKCVGHGQLTLGMLNKLAADLALSILLGVQTKFVLDFDLDDMIKCLDDGMFDIHARDDFNDKMILLQSKLATLSSHEGSLARVVPNSLGEIFISLFWSYSAGLGGLLGQTNPRQEDLVDVIRHKQLIAFGCSLQDAGISIRIGGHALENNSRMIIYPFNSIPVDCYLFLPFGVAAICSDDGNSWGIDLLLAAKTLFSGLLHTNAICEFSNGNFIKVPTKLELTVQ